LSAALGHAREPSGKDAVAMLRRAKENCTEDRPEATFRAVNDPATAAVLDRDLCRCVWA
jgi:hypothetical protein